MESIYVLAMAKSHRTSNDKELIRWDEEYAKIEGRVRKEIRFNTTGIDHFKKREKGKVQSY